MRHTVTDALVRAALRRLTGRVLTGRLRVSRDVAGGRLTRADVRAVWATASELFAGLGSELPDEPTTGSRIAVRLAAWTLALDRALQAHGVAAGDAHALVSDVAWAAYRPFVAAKGFRAGLFIRDPQKRLAALVATQQRFPFNPPGWQHRPVPAEPLAIDVARCPIADYLGSHHAEDVCLSAWCAQDGPAAELWGARLERSGTLVGGAPVCDFRYVAANAHEDSSTSPVKHRSVSGAAPTPTPIRTPPRPDCSRK